MSRPTIFISYSHNDEAWKDRLLTHLGVLEQQGLLDLWDDHRIGAGEDWYLKIQDAMTRAKVAFLLISSDFLSSNFILQEEVPRLLELREQEGLHLFPVLLRPCAWKVALWVKPMQIRPQGARPLSGGSEYQIDEDLATVAEEVWEILNPTVQQAVHTGYVAFKPEKISLAKLPTTSKDLFGREEQLKKLNAAWAEEGRKLNIVSLVAGGGVGKTALVMKWLLNMSKDNFRGAKRVLGWSFYSQGATEKRQTSADPFISFALGWFGDPDPTRGSPWEKGERLAEFVKQQRTLLILDGLEPLQHPPGVMGGGLRDPGLQALLRELAFHNPGLCVITTRLPVDDLTGFVGSSVERVDLDNLSPVAGGILLEKMGVKEELPGELKEASQDFSGHALALNLLGSYLNLVDQGDVRQRGKIPPLNFEEEQGKYARRMMAAYEVLFQGKPELNILYIMGLFDRPAEAGALAVLLAEPLTPGLTDNILNISSQEWSLAVQTLRQAKLLAEADPEEPDTLDCHPLVREHFGERMKNSDPEAWQEAHGRLFEYFQKAAKEFPDTLEEMVPLYRAVAHGCQAGRAQEALVEVYIRRILRGEDHYSWRKLGAFGADLAALASFFDVPWRQTAVALTLADQAFVLGQAGFRLRAMGRLDEAAEPLQAALDAAIQQQDWENAAIAAANLSQLHLARGSLAEALEAANQALDLAQRSEDLFQRMVRTANVAAVLHQLGRPAEAEALFRQAEELQKQRQPESPLLYSLRGFRYCDLLLDRGRLTEVLERAEQTLEMSIKVSLSLLAIALDHLSLGRGYFMQALDENRLDFTLAASHLNKAVQGLRQAGTQHHLPRGLLAQAALFRVTGDFHQAQRDLDEVLALAERSGMRLHEADGHLEYARLHLAQNARDQAREHLEKAKKIITETGYHRRDAEVAELEEQLQEQP